MPRGRAAQAAATRRVVGAVVVCATAAVALSAAVRSPALAARAASVSTPSTVAARLSTAQLVGQRIIYAYAGTTPPSALLKAVSAGEAAGVILFGPNVASPPALTRGLAALARANAASPIRAPLLIMTDQEGGLVRRLPGAPTLSEKQIGASANAKALAAAAGVGAGNVLRAAGVNVNLAPVLDVYRTPGDFIDRYQRSYGSSAAAVAALGGAFITAQQRTGVAATAKHFPGLGAAATSADTDLGPVTLAVPLAQLRSVDELPYRTAIAAGVSLVMVSWATYPALDPQRPAGLSSAVIQGELRGRLGFRGVTITDGLGAGALARYGGFGQRGLLAAQAGADLLLCAVVDPTKNTPNNGLAALGALATALQDGTLSRAAAQQAATRVIALRSGH